MRTIKIKKSLKGISGYVRISENGNEIRLTVNDALRLSKRLLDAAHSFHGAHIVFIDPACRELDKKTS